MIDNDSKQQVKIIELSSKQEARNTELGLQEIAKSQKEINKLKKDQENLRKQLEENQRYVTSLKNTGQKDTQEYYKAIDKSDALKSHIKKVGRTIGGHSSQISKNKSKFGIPQKASIQFNEKGEAFYLNEEETEEFKSQEKRTKNNALRKRVQDEFFKTEKAKGKLTGENNDRVKKVNKSLVDTNRVLNAFKASLVGFGLYKAITGVIKSGNATTNELVTSAAKMNVSAETAKAISYFGQRLGGEAMRGKVEDTFVASARLKERVGNLGRTIPADMIPAFGRIGLDAEDVMASLPYDFTIKVMDTALKKYKRNEFKTADEMYAVIRDILGDSGVDVMKAIFNIPELTRMESIGDAIDEGKKYSSMPANHLLDVADYNKSTAELFTRLDTSMQKIANFFQRIGTPIIELLNSVLNFLSPDRATKQKEMKEIMESDGKYNKFLYKLIGKYSDEHLPQFGVAFRNLKDNNDYNDLTLAQQEKIANDVYKQFMLKNKVTEDNRERFIQNFKNMERNLDRTNYGREALSNIGFGGVTTRELIHLMSKMKTEHLQGVGNVIYRQLLTPPISGGWASSTESSGFGGGVGTFLLRINVDGKTELKELLKQGETKEATITATENTR